LHDIAVLLGDTGGLVAIGAHRASRHVSVEPYR